MERELTLKDMFVIILKRAKPILIWTLAVGILLGGFGIYRSYRAMTGTEGGKSAAEQYAQDVSSAQKALEHTQKKLDGLEEYLENSIYYSIDPYNKGVCSLLFYVDTDYQINPALTYQQPDKTAHVVAAYTQLYKSDEVIMDEIYQMLGRELETKYIFELIRVESSEDTPNNLVRISVVNEDVEVAQRIAHYLYEEMESRIQTTVAPHTTHILADYAGYEIDTEALEQNDAVTASLEELHAELAERQEELDALLKKPVQPSNGISKMTLLKQGLKYGALGVAAGLILGCCAALFGSVLRGRLNNAGMAAARYKFPLLGVLPQDNRKRWFNKWIAGLENDPLSTYEESAQVVAANLAAVSEGKSVVLIGTGAPAALQKLAHAIEGEVSAGGNILTDAAAVQALCGDCGVVLVEERDSARLEQVDAEVLRLTALDKKILGMVLC